MQKKKINLWRKCKFHEMSFSPSTVMVYLKKSAGLADRKVRFRISLKNYTVNPYTYNALKIGQL